MSNRYTKKFISMISENGICKDSGVTILNSKNSMLHGIESWKKAGYDGIPVIFQDIYDKYNCISCEMVNRIESDNYIGYCNKIEKDDVFIDFVNNDVMKESSNVQYANFVFQITNILDDLRYNATSVYFILLDRLK